MQKIRVYHSADKGLTWTNPSLIPVADTNHRSFDHPSLAVDISTNKIYVLASHVVLSPATNETGNRARFTIAISSSEDNGRTFSIPLVLSPSNLKYQAANVVVLPGYKAVFSFFDFASPDWNSLLGVRTLWSVSSDGNTISRPSFVVQYSDFRNLTHLAVDISGKEFNNRIYSVFANYGGKIEPYNQDDNEAEILWPNRGIYLANSLDSGKTWSVPQIIEKSGNMFSARYCNVAVNNQGTVAVAWMEAEDSTKKCFVPYMVVSKDGGKNFSNKIKVSDKVKCMIPDKEANTMGKVNAASRFQIGGDYFGLSGGPDDSFYMSWSEPELKTGRLQLWLTKLTVEKEK